MKQKMFPSFVFKSLFLNLVLLVLTSSICNISSKRKNSFKIKNIESK